MCGPYKQRNELLAAMVATSNPRSIFEFAAGAHQLAQMILTSAPSVSKYAWSDFAPVICERALPLVKTFPQFVPALLDIDLGYNTVVWPHYDTVISVSLEHLEHDREVMAAVFPRAAVFLSLPGFDAAGHWRYFESEEAVHARYDDLLSIEEIRRFEFPYHGGTRHKFLIHGKRR